MFSCLFQNGLKSFLKRHSYFNWSIDNIDNKFVTPHPLICKPYDGSVQSTLPVGQENFIMGLFKNFHVINNVLFLSASHGKILTSSSYIMFLISHFFGSMVVSNGSVILAKKNVKTAEQRSTYLLISDFQPIVFIHDCTAYDPAPL